MESTWAQLIAGLLAVAGLFVGGAHGGALSAATPLRQPPDTASRRRPRR